MSYAIDKAPGPLLGQLGGLVDKVFDCGIEGLSTGFVSPPWVLC